MNIGQGLTAFHRAGAGGASPALLFIANMNFGAGGEFFLYAIDPSHADPPSTLVQLRPVAIVNARPSMSQMVAVGGRVFFFERETYDTAGTDWLLYSMLVDGSDVTIEQNFGQPAGGQHYDGLSIGFDKIVYSYSGGSPSRLFNDDFPALDNETIIATIGSFLMRLTMIDDDENIAYGNLNAVVRRNLTTNLWADGDNCAGVVYAEPEGKVFVVNHDQGGIWQFPPDITDSSNFTELRAEDVEFAIAYDPNGREVYVGTNEGETQPQAIIRFDAQTGASAVDVLRVGDSTPFGTVSAFGTNAIINMLFVPPV